MVTVCWPPGTLPDPTAVVPPEPPETGTEGVDAGTVMVIVVPREPTVIVSWPDTPWLVVVAAGGGVQMGEGPIVRVKTAV